MKLSQLHYHEYNESIVGKNIAKMTLCAIYFCILSCTFTPTHAAYLQDNASGTYADDFADNSGLSNYQGYAGTSPTMPASTYAKVDITSGTLKLTNSGGTFEPPYSSTGYVYTKTIMPSSVSKWGTFTFVSNLPAGTSVKIQVTDDYNGLFTEEQLPGNTAGFTSSTIDLHNLAVLSTSKEENPYSSNEKVARIKFKITLSTSDTTETPSIESISFNWTPKTSSLPIASSLNNSGWPTGNFDNQGTNHTTYSALEYPVIRWKSDSFANNSMVLNSLRVYQDYLLGQTWFKDNHMYWLDRKTGETIRELDMDSPLRGDNSIDKNGIMYSNEILNDITTAVDLNTGQIKWTHAFSGGHGNSQAIIGTDGTIYSIYQSNLICNTACVSQTSTLYAFNPDGSIKFTKDYTIEEEYHYAGKISIGLDETLYFGTLTQDIDANSTNNGKLYAVSPNNGSVLWTYETGDLDLGSPILDKDGNIYVYQYDYNAPNAKKMYSISPSGDLNWERSIDSSFRGWRDVSLNDNNTLTAIKIDNDYQNTHYLETIDATNGSLIKEIQVNYPSNLFTDNTNNANFLSYSSIDGINFDTINSYNDNLDLNWQIYDGLPSSTNENVNTSYGFQSLIQDEKSWLYSGFTKTVYNSITQEHTYGQEYASFIAIAPWTITPSVKNAGNLKIGDTIDFEVTTTMQKSNPLTGNDNQMQVVMDDSTKLPMTYLSTNSDGDTLWTASTIVTSYMVGRTNNYTIEANADNVKTNLAVNFASPKTNSDNTGYKKNGSFVTDDQPPIFIILPDQNTQINIFEGQTITTNPFLILVKPIDNIAIQKVEFYIDNILIGTKYQADSNGVYECPWDTSKYHSDVKVLAYDTGGNVSTLTRTTAVSIPNSPNTGLSKETYLVPIILVIIGLALLIISRKRQLDKIKR